MGNEEAIRPVGARGGLISSGGEALCLQGWQGSMAIWMGCIVRFTCSRGVRQPVSVLQLGWLVWVAVGVVFVWGGCTRFECGMGGMVWLLMQSGCMEGPVHITVDVWGWLHVVGVGFWCTTWHRGAVHNSVDVR